MGRGQAGACPPSGASCEGLLTADVGLVGEGLPEYPVFRAQALAERADLGLGGGSALTVGPAASVPRTAADAGATLCIVNLDRTDLSDRAEYDFRADATDILPALQDAVRKGS